MRFSIRFVFALLLCVFFDSAAFSAETQKEKSVSLDAADESRTRPPWALDDVVVTAKRIPGLQMDPHSIPAHITVIPAEEIARTGARTTLDVLQQMPGVSVLDTRFGMGADGSVNLRGIVNGSRSAVLVLVDGIRQNRVTGDEVHWLAIPVNQIERMEVLRGGAGTIYGEGALAGVINIVTKRGGPRPLGGDSSLETGSYGWLRSVINAGGAKDAWSYNFSVTRQLWDGYRDSTSSRASTVSASATWTPRPETSIDMTTSFHDDTSHFAGGLTTATVERDRRNPGTFSGFFEDKIAQFGATVTQQIGEAWTLVGNLFARQWDEDITTTGTFANIAPSHGGGLRAAHEMGRDFWHAATVAGFELFDEKATTGLRTSTLSESNREGGAAFIEETLKLFQKWVLTAGVRYDKSFYKEDLAFPTFTGKIKFSGSSPKVGLNYLLNDTASTYVSWARSFKAPNIDDLDAVLPPFTDSVDVKPQVADTAETGVRWDAAPWAKFQGAVFHTHIDNEIIFNAGTFSNQNFTTRRVGTEWSVHGGRWNDRLLYGATYALVKARFSKGDLTGNVIPGTPEHIITLRASYRIAPWLEAASDYRWVDTPFRINNLANTLPGDIYGVADMSLRYLRPRHEIYFTIQNFLDEEYSSFQSSSGTAVSTGENPAPPRTFLIGAKVKL
ncbi:MAG: TonB-dependent receptor [Candidatus Omnitrophica bacterium]|nr:TonB-dependent receptor [Candidatus Omnitrophota bacterium]